MHSAFRDLMHDGSDVARVLFLIKLEIRRRAPGRQKLFETLHFVIHFMRDSRHIKYDTRTTVNELEVQSAALLVANIHQ